MFTQPFLVIVAYSSVMQSDTITRIRALNAHLYLEVLYFIFWVSELVST